MLSQSTSNDVTRPQLSFVVPIYNEENTIKPLFEKIHDTLNSLSPQIDKFEVIMVDDGSSDSSWKQISELHMQFPESVVGIRLRRNCGKSTALAAGIKKVKAEILITMDGDLQDDPSEIPKFLLKLSEGYHCVSGWKKNRKDPWFKRAPSILFNKVTSFLTGLKLHDHNCGFKAYKIAALSKVNLYGDLHRYVPALIYDLGFNVCEIPVVHHSRRYGKSKFGNERFARGFLDLLTVIAITKYSHRPAHLIGGAGILIGFLGMTIFTYLSILWLMGERPIGTRPLFQLSIFALMVAVQMVAVGLLAELIISRTRSSFSEEVIEDELDVSDSR
jgi:glycosyltransferase involved in cell wall biosynthesis